MLVRRAGGTLFLLLVEWSRLLESERIAIRLVIGLTIVLAVFGVHAGSEIRSGADSRWTVHLAYSLLRDRDLYLDEYRETLARFDFYFIEETGGHLVHAYPVAISVLAAPFVAALDPIIGPVVPLPSRLLAERGDAELVKFWTIEATIASFWVALAALFVFLTAQAITSTAGAVVVALAFAFGTTAWSTASRGLWGHAPSLLFLSMAIWLLLQAPRRPASAGWAGLPLGLATAARPQDWLSVVILGGVVALRSRRQLPGYLATLAIALVPVLGYQLWIYGQPFSPYSSPTQLLTAANMLEAIAGILISPSRGLFIYSPILLLALAGAVARARSGRWTLLDSAFAAVVALHTLMIASFVNWWGGHSFGPRLMTDVLPYLMVFLAYGVEAVRRLPAAPRRLAAATTALLLALSVAIHAIGANNYAVNFWNAEPVSVNDAPSRLWDVRDAQLLRWRPWIP
ncbi:MAG: hypothetical protein RMM58_10610 [Chloroflexota bacterium]|nr:hypothetical protein [Dehalococcoidia bacterium]MDW8254316.1 hypothetical protein [Chloroflexota bacterium]